MRTDELAHLLSQGAGPAPRHLAAKRLIPTASLGLVISACLAIMIIGLIPKSMFEQPLWWLKLGYVAVLAVLSGWLVSRLAKPGTKRPGALAAVVATPLTMLLLGVIHTVDLPANQRMVDWMGHSWRTCPFNILALSLPALIGGLWAVKGLAPVSPTWAGAAVGLCAGAIGASGYAFACTETSPAFVATWYSLGVLMVTLLGAALGQRWLRW